RCRPRTLYDTRFRRSPSKRLVAWSLLAQPARGGATGLWLPRIARKFGCRDAVGTPARKDAASEPRAVTRTRIVDCGVATTSATTPERPHHSSANLLCKLSRAHCAQKKFRCALQRSCTEQVV